MNHYILCLLKICLFKCSLLRFFNKSSLFFNVFISTFYVLCMYSMYMYLIFYVFVYEVIQTLCCGVLERGSHSNTAVRSIGVVKSFEHCCVEDWSGDVRKHMDS